MDSSTAQGRPRRYRLTLVATAVATGGVAAWALIPQELASSTALLTRMTAPAEEAQPEAARPRGLRVQVVRLAPLVEERSLTGTVVARHKAPVGFRVAGKVLARHVEVGQAVRAGEPLLDLDPADYELALGAAEAALGAAQAQVRQAAAEDARQASLLAAGWVSQSSYDRVRAASDAAREAAAAAEDQVAIARDALGYTRLVAPTDGVVTTLMAEAGQVVAQGQPVVTLVRPGPREVLVGVPEGQVAALEEWQATASLWSDPAARHEASLREVAPEAPQRRGGPVGARRRAGRRPRAGRDGGPQAGARPLMEGLPPGYRIAEGGAIEESAKANAALFSILPLMFLIMLTLIVFQMRSLSKTILVFLTFPLGFIGASFALWITGQPFGFVALLGILALGGIIVRNTLILADQIDTDIRSGLSMRTAIVETTVRRARPVILTALAAFFAFLPLTLTSFWGPMATVLIGGTLVGTALTLLFLPALYAAWFRVPNAEADAQALAPDHDAHPSAAWPQATAMGRP